MSEGRKERRKEGRKEERREEKETKIIAKGLILKKRCC